MVSTKKGYNALEDRKPLLKVKGDEVVEFHHLSEGPQSWEDHSCE